ncbi:hypothetical protein [Microbacterium sp.]|uniref:hypothetical protein n=1 Tax=Microbacterium sp. TaxID=51671 RepID=UPI003A94AB19
MRLFARDSRHVALTPEGVRFLADARVLLAHAERMTTPSTGIRIAHIFDLDTSRVVAEAFMEEFPETPVMASSMDSQRQFDALIDGLLDVAILRITPAMLAEHPLGWHHQALRLEPFWLVGQQGDAAAESASLHERPIQVFGDPNGSSLYNVHGQYFAALEHHLAIEFRWLGNPGTFEHCLSRMVRTTDTARLLEFESYALRYRRIGMPVHRPAEVQPLYPWSLAWRDEPLTDAVAGFIETGLREARARDWLTPDAGAVLWQP